MRLHRSSGWFYSSPPHVPSISVIFSFHVVTEPDFDSFMSLRIVVVGLKQPFSDGSRLFFFVLSLGRSSPHGASFRFCGPPREIAGIRPYASSSCFFSRAAVFSPVSVLPFSFFFFGSLVVHLLNTVKNLSAPI